VRARPLLLAAGVAALAGEAAPAAATTCDVSPQGVSFGAYEPLSPSQLDGVGNIAVRCDGATSFTVEIGAGGGSFADRHMRGAADDLHYNLYQEPSRITVWGDGTGGGSTLSVTGQDLLVPIYGRIPARQNVRPGAYGDTIVVTITY